MPVLKRLLLGMLLATAAWAAEADPAALIEQGHYKHARALLEKRLAANPKDADALVLMARVKLAYSDPEAARSLLQQAIVLQPKNSSAHLFLADAYSRRANDAGFFEKIKLAKIIQNESNEALADDPKSVDAMGGLMSFYLEAPGVMGGSVSKAREMADRIMALDRVRGNFAQAEIASHEKEFAQVQGFYLKAVEADPKSYLALVALAGYYLGDRSKDYPKAADYAQKALALDPSRIGAYALLAQAYVFQERWAELDTLLAHAEKNVPDNLAPYYVAGRTLILSSKDPARAERYFRKYLTQPEPEGNTPPLAAAHWRLGLALERLGRKQEAIQEIQTAVQMKPDLKEAQKDLKRLKS
jgi:tetratricopeptide (TPR) repeat protein